MTTLAPSPTRATVGAVLLGINALIFVGTEAIAAAGWRDPVYSYAYNYISDLGVPEVEAFQGRLINSSLS